MAEDIDKNTSAASTAEQARARARRKARIDHAFGSLYPGQGYTGQGGFSADHYEQQRPPHHDR